MNFLEKCLCVELSLYQIVISFLKNRNRKPKGNKKNKNLQKNICDNAFFFLETTTTTTTTTTSRKGNHTFVTISSKSTSHRRTS